MSEILNFWVSRLSGRHELDRNDVIDDVLMWGRQRGVKLHWVVPVLGRTDVRFFTSKAFKSVRYNRKTMLLLGGDIEFPAECVGADGRVNDAHMESVLHELWHAYCQHFAEKNEGEPAIAQLYASAVVGLSGQVQESAVREAADEAIGGYISTVVECLKLHIPNAGDAELAQRLWAAMGSEDRRTVELTGRDYPRINAVCRLPDRVARDVRVRLFGLEDSVWSWPKEAKTWERDIQA